ncbi:MAG: PKD domain-containing protein [Chloroflexi bacterium]|nr:PKD domain-containing protein [Chloroflexota bacterium]
MTNPFCQRQSSPSRPFPAGDFVQVSVTTGTQNLSGEELAQPTVWQFRTAVAPSSGQFTPTNQALNQNFVSQIHVGDFNQDSYMDILHIGLQGVSSNNRIWFNDGQNNFWPSMQILGGSYDRAAVGDLDNDGDLDIVVGNYNDNGLARVLINDGLGNFTVEQSFIVDYVRGLDIGDIDGDGDFDVVFNTLYDQNQIWLNDGTGNLTLGVQSLNVDWNETSKLVDVDNDGDLDAVILTPGQIWLNDGTGVFANTGQSLGDQYNLGIGDVNGDGYVDIITCRYEEFTQLWLNNGNGFFTLNGQSLGGNHYECQLADIDGDGDLDLVTANFLFPTLLWLNNGAGFFNLSPQVLSPASAIGLGDLDNDGDIDMLLGGENGVEIWVNDGTNITPISGLTAVNDSPTLLGQPTYFTATIASGQYVAYTWDFGDGSVGQGATPMHTYATTGTYTAWVTAANPISNSAISTTVVVTAPPVTPISGLTAVNDSPTQLGHPTQFTATIAAGQNVTYTWAFGDGNMAEGATVTHTYAATGTYTAWVTAANPISNSAISTTVVVTAPPVTPISGLTAVNDSPTQLCHPTQFTATIAAGQHVTYTWAFGDGNVAEGATVAHTYTATGIYTAWVTAANPISNSAISTTVGGNGSTRRSYRG